MLKQHNVKATFFCIGSRIDKYPITAKRIVEEGHEIGNHTMNHVYFHRLKRKDILQELHSSAHHIRSLQPEGDKLFRPPGGSLNQTAFKSILKEGYHIIMWSWNQDPRDWKRPGKGKSSGTLFHMPEMEISFFCMTAEETGARRWRL